jgi:fatty acyl-CoA reductase
MSSPDSEVAEFFRGRSVFVTGASGFMGKVLLEKLLYTCPDLHAIYILIRSKRSKTPEQRAEEMFKIPVSFRFHCFLVRRSVVLVFLSLSRNFLLYRGADKSLARPTSRCILFDGENISFDASLVIYVSSTTIPPLMIINRIYKNQNLLSL